MLVLEWPCLVLVMTCYNGNDLTGIESQPILHQSFQLFNGFAGLFMALQPKIIACGKTVAAFSMAVRFLTGPAVMAASSIAVGLRGVLLHIAVVQVKDQEIASNFWLLIWHIQLNRYMMNELYVFIVFSGCSSTGNCSFCLCKGVQRSSRHTEHNVSCIFFSMLDQ